MKDNSRPAFPYVYNFGPGEYGIEDGISQRDYFAAQAIIGIIAHPTGKGGMWECAARDAYLAADAMLKVREE